MAGFWYHQRMKLNFRLGKVVNYVHQKENIGPKELKKFFGKKPIEKLLQNETVNALFNEWLVFDYRNKFGTTAIAEYYLKNPDHLLDEQLKQLEQVIKTERYEMLEVLNVIKDQGLSVRVVRTGEVFFVDDLTGSRSAIAPSLFFNRLAKVDDKWILVGSDNLSFPIKLSQEDRIHFARILNKEKNTPKLVIDIFCDRFLSET